jgi:hypothetical protein
VSLLFAGMIVSTIGIGYLMYGRRQAKFVECEDLVRDDPEHPGHCAPLDENIAPESRQPLYPERKVKFIFFLEPMFLCVSQDTVAQLFGLNSGQGRLVHRRQLTVDAYLGRAVGGNVQIGPAPLDKLFQHLMQICHNVSFSGSYVQRAWEISCLSK